MKPFVALLLAGLLTLSPLVVVRSEATEVSPTVETSIPEDEAEGEELPPNESLEVPASQGESAPENPPEGPADEEKGLLEDVVSVQRVIVPTQFQFIIDPFEIRDQGQIYSGPFVVENRGEEPVRIYLEDLHCIASSDAIQFVKEPIDLTTESAQKDIQLIFQRIEPGTHGVKAESSAPDAKDGTEEVTSKSATDPADGENTFSESTDAKEEDLSFLLSAMDEEEQTITAVSTGPTMEVGDKLHLSSSPVGAICFVLESGEKAEFELTGTVNAFSEEPWRAGDVQFKMHFEIVPLSEEQQKILDAIEARKAKEEAVVAEEQPLEERSSSTPAVEPPEEGSLPSTSEVPLPEGESSAPTPEVQKDGSSLSEREDLSSPPEDPTLEKEKDTSDTGSETGTQSDIEPIADSEGEIPFVPADS